MQKERFTIKQFNEKYSTNDDCLHQIFVNRYGHLKECPKCKKDFSYHKVTGRKCYACAYCGKQIHPLSGTIFHKSSTSLKDWFYAVFLFSVSKNGVSAKELERQLGVTYKTAWRMAKKIRELLKEDVGMLGNKVEADETYMGGLEKNKHAHKKTEGNQGRSNKTKTPIVGIVERDGKIITKVTDDTKSSTVKPLINETVKKGSTVMTDEYLAYNGLDKEGFDHTKVNHGTKEYVKGVVHTNCLEGFWSQLKRSVNGTYHAVSAKYLQNYVNEFSYRYNRRNQEQPLFHGIIEQVWKLAQ